MEQVEETMGMVLVVEDLVEVVTVMVEVVMVKVVMSGVVKREMVAKVEVVLMVEV
jgi:hypothetical protein